MHNNNEISDKNNNQLTRSHLKTQPSSFESMKNRGFAMTWLTIKSILFDKKTLVVGAILIILLAIPGYWLWRPPSDSEDASLEMFLIIMIIFYLQFLVLYVCFLYGSGLITSELEDKTMTYLISRPISKLEILVYKYLGYIISIFIIFAIPTTLNYLMLASHDGVGNISENWRYLAYALGGIFIGVVAWGALFLFFASIFKNPLAPGILYCLFWESFIANIGMNISKVSVTYQIRTFIFNGLASTSKLIAEDDDLPFHGNNSPSWTFITAITISVFFVFMAWFILKDKDIN